MSDSPKSKIGSYLQVNTPYEYQRSDDPDRYYNSGRIRMYGGFEEAYYEGEYSFATLDK